MKLHTLFGGKGKHKADNLFYLAIIYELGVYNSSKHNLACL